jgi:uncharacterized membrane-anchored protein YitT (DUF2179 family)
MTTLRRFTMDDLLKFNNINLDVLTETYNMPFYMLYMSRWPESFTGTRLFPDNVLLSVVTHHLAHCVQWPKLQMAI